MRLPGLDHAVVTERKVTRYLLAVDHPTGRHKALWLMAHGFRLEAWEVLVEAIKRHAFIHEVLRAEGSPFGNRYVVEGPFMTPDGRDPPARSIWFVEAGGYAPLFVTVYPVRRSGP